MRPAACRRNQNLNIVSMKRSFEEEVVEETTVTEESTESTPDSHEQFVTLLTEMGLSAEQAEAVHQMAMDLVENASGDPGVEKVEASRVKRGGYSRGGSRRMGRGARAGESRMGHSRPSRRRGMSADRRPTRNQRPSRGGRREMSGNDMGRQLRQQRRAIRELRQQITELSQQLGHQPGAAPLNTAPKNVAMSAPQEVPTQGSPKDRVMAMLKHTF